MKIIGITQIKIFYFLSIFLVAIASYIILETQSFKIPIFAFHNIVDVRETNLFSSRATYLDYSVQNLETFLTNLVRDNYWFLSTQELDDYFLTRNKKIPAEYLGKKPVMLTFDDGYKNIDIYLKPLLQKLSLKVVLFINPKYMNNSKEQTIKYLSCQDLQTGIKQGLYDVQSHGFSHRDLTKITAEELEFELLESQQQLKKCVANLAEEKNIAQHLAYPYNRVNHRVKKFTTKYYSSAYGYRSKLRQWLFLFNRYQIPRIGVNQEDSPEKLLKFAWRSPIIN